MAIDKDKMPARLRWAVEELETIRGTVATSEESRRCAQRMLDAAECDYPALDAAADDGKPLCTVTASADGGRSETTCPDVAKYICARCGAGRCGDHLAGDHALAFYRVVEDEGFQVVCADCRPDWAADAEELD